MHNKNPSSWLVKATKKRPNRAYVWNDNYQQGCYLLWPVDTKTLRAEFEDVAPSAKTENFNYEMSPKGARFLACGNVDCIAFAEERPSVDIVAHECYHFMNYEMEYRGIPHKGVGVEKGGDDSEARAYFLQWAVREVARMVNAKV